MNMGFSIRKALSRISLPVSMARYVHMLVTITSLGPVSSLIPGGRADFKAIDPSVVPFAQLSSSRLFVTLKKSAHYRSE